jgi:asparagine synthase (glutamine-hydrolysing)
MCGICGIFRSDGGPVDPDRVVAMRDAMIPRGPDAAGLESGAGFALGHRRLSILDLSEAGRQPMANEDGSILLVLNGEIYNFADLRPELEAAGHRFHSHTDTEVLLHGYEQWGFETLLERIRGMYAFALLDRPRWQLHLARDPLGKKPLFFRFEQGALVFASSARALSLGLNATPDIDLLAVDDLLWNQSIPGARTIFRGVRKLLPGRAWSVGRDGTPREFVHWQRDFFHPDGGAGVETWLQRIEESLTQAIRRRFVADVPVGVMLSGGVDSGLITALASKALGRVKTFSVTNEDPRQDETAYAAAVARQYQTDHHVLPVTSNVRRDLPRLVAAMGEPLADASAANLFAIAQLARRHVTVVLTGDGGDEAFGGYTETWAAHYAQKLQRWIPAALRPPLAGGARLLHRSGGMLHRAGTFLQMASQPLERTFSAMSPAQRRIRLGLYTPELRASLLEHSPFQQYRDVLEKNRDALWSDRLMQAHLETLLPDDYLAKVDYATMGASLEARSPFLDVDVLDVAMRIPASMRYHGGHPKGLLRTLARRHLPASGVDRSKQGFTLPVEMWLRGAWTDLVQDFVLGPHVERRGWFCRNSLEQIVARQKRGERLGPLLWALIILELWLRMAIDRTLGADDAL